VKIFHFGAGIHFANSDHFKQSVFQLTGLDPVKWREGAKAREKQLRSSGRSGTLPNDDRDAGDGPSVLCCFRRKAQHENFKVSAVSLPPVDVRKRNGNDRNGCCFE
jgi:predicted component of type VI protein secretion system